MTEEYKSIEHKIWEIASPFVKAAYGTTVSLCRAPTLIRKTKEGNSFAHNLGKDWRNPNHHRNSSMGLLGLMGGVVIVGNAIDYIIHKTSEGDYTPLAALAITNILSGIYEASKSHKT